MPGAGSALLTGASANTIKQSKPHEEAVRLKPGYAEALYNLGVAYAQKGDRTKVTQVYEKLRQANPELADQFFRKVVLP